MVFTLLGDLLVLGQGSSFLIAMSEFCRASIIKFLIPLSVPLPKMYAEERSRSPWMDKRTIINLYKETVREY